MINITGYHLIFLIRLNDARNEMKAYMRNRTSDEDLTILSFRLNNNRIIDSGFSWIEDMEFSWKEKRYDVVDMKKKEGCLLIRCIDDKNETELVDKYMKIIYGNRSSPENKTIRLMQLMDNLYLYPEVPSVGVAIFTLKRYGVYIIPSYLSSSIEIPTPPPSGC